jgi:hypothetical protein
MDCIMARRDSQNRARQDRTTRRARTRDARHARSPSPPPPPRAGVTRGVSPLRPPTGVARGSSVDDDSALVDSAVVVVDVATLSIPTSTPTSVAAAPAAAAPAGHSGHHRRRSISPMTAFRQGARVSPSGGSVVMGDCMCHGDTPSIWLGSHKSLFSCSTCHLTIRAWCPLPRH